MKTQTLLAGVAIIIALLVGIAVGSFLLPMGNPSPTITLSQNPVAVGSAYNVTLFGFPANTDIYGWTVNEHPPRTWLAGVTDANGKLTLSGIAPNATGQWPLLACDESQEYWATVMLNVTQ